MILLLPGMFSKIMRDFETNPRRNDSGGGFERAAQLLGKKGKKGPDYQSEAD
jgi:hypothetical protein